MKRPVPGRAARVVVRVAAWSAAGGVALLAGCASVAPPGSAAYRTGPILAHVQRDDEVGDCARHLQAIDAKVDQRRVRDAMAPRVAGFPYLRVDRLSASLAPKVSGAVADSAAARTAWLARLSALDREARLVEFSNGELHAAEWAALERCRPQLLAADFGNLENPALRAERQRFDELVAAAVVPDDYSESLRTLGLYPLTRYAFVSGIRGWHRRTREVFALPDNRLPTVGERVRYGPVAAEDTSTLAGLPATPLTAGAQPSSVDALGVPRLTRAEGWELLLRHAPVLAVDTATLDDRLGRIGWRTEPGEGGGVTLPAVDVALPAAYSRIAFGRVGGQVRVQLVYTFWFPARPPESRTDALAGALDAIVWRVTLADLGERVPPTALRAGPPEGERTPSERPGGVQVPRTALRAGPSEGERTPSERPGGVHPAAPAPERFVPLTYDTIHACGCYHLFLPTERVRERPQPDTVDEGLFVPRRLVAPRAGQRIVLHVASRTHYLQQVTVEPEAAAVAANPDETRQPALRYALRDDNELRVLTLPRGGTRSIYDEHGFVPGSERFERYFFWPMGIASAGQMRQWGRHATAFVGRRHFDDPALLEQYFDVVGP